MAWFESKCLIGLTVLQNQNVEFIAKKTCFISDTVRLPWFARILTSRSRRKNLTDFKTFVKKVAKIIITAISQFNNEKKTYYHILVIKSKILMRKTMIFFLKKFYSEFVNLPAKKFLGQSFLINLLLKFHLLQAPYHLFE